MRHKNEYRIDERTVGDLRKQISRLSKSYTPEWVFDTHNPDVGSVIGLIFANQMSENIKKVNLVINKYHTEFVNMLNIGLLPSYPAHGVVVMDLIANTISGVEVEKGTKLMANAEDAQESQIIFETLSDVYVTNARLTDIIAVSGHFGKIIPLRGQAKPAKLFDEVQEDVIEEEDEAVEEPPIQLFDYSGKGIEKNGILLYHKSVFDTFNNMSISVFVKSMDTGELLGEQLADSSMYRWNYYTKNGLMPFDSVSLEDGIVLLKKDNSGDWVKLEGEEYQLVYLEAIKPVNEAINVEEIRISSACGPVTPTFISHNSDELEPSKFMPFGELVSVFDECYIGYDSIFSQQGAIITISFELSAKEKVASYSLERENEELKVIKRKPRSVLFDTANTSPQRVSFDYYNGLGWKRLQCKTDMSTVFDGSYGGHIEISFLCPDNWKALVVGGYNERALRIRVSQADNCYLQPCIHKMPVIENMKIEYSYFDEWKSPQRLRRVCGTDLSDLTDKVLSLKPFTAFSPLQYADNALYLGFNRKFAGSPISILFDVDESVYFESSPIRFEYSTLNGFQQMKVIDHTRNMAGAGTVLFVPPMDFAMVKLEGQSRYWVKITDEDASFDDADRYHSIIRSIRLNAIEIYNVETLPEEEFYIEASMPNMSFPIAAENILTADVYVNEKNNISQTMMKQMIQEESESVRVEYNFLGDISNFFIKWTEVENFDESKSTDRHYLIDRMNSRIIFGDGISVMIPTASTGVALTVQVKCCNGVKGNLPKGAVDSSFGRILYIEKIENPISTYAGSNIESIESAHIRGANIINSQKRLVSELDFTCEVSSFSTSINKVLCVVGRDLDGKKIDSLVSIVIMMKDYEDGAYSFNSIKDRLKQRLIEKCETTINSTVLSITEPIYVYISVDVWVEVNNVDNFFEVQNNIKELIREFINPITDEKNKGWDIGVLPDEEQIKMMIKHMKREFTQKFTVITAKYADKLGVHECDLNSLKNKASRMFMIGCNGVHTVHMMLNE